MAKKRRGKGRVLSAIPGVATKAPLPTTRTPLFISGTTNQPQPTDTPCTVPLLPQTVIDIIIDHLYDKPVDLRVCSLVSKSWKARSQSHLFRKVRWTMETVPGWRKHIPPRSDGPAGHTTSFVVVSLMEQDRLGLIKDYFTSFRNVTSLTLQDLDFDDGLFDPEKGRAGDYSPSLPSSFASNTLRSLDRGHLNRHTNLIKLLSRAPLPKVHTIRLEHWGKMYVEDFDSLLKSCSKYLEILDGSRVRGFDPISAFVHA
ncbi:hypothetical protein BDM02DRAFT_1721168 [Thelephora ganbajun]|uniref:Uncharacterized protein n=1 Tax=Thelephora ganbajun TaxID=370292 RepID=A0ACB6ZKA2_THEGA|nr:hypothetical protein BDM02DRAFT_1721168 [Thelephora ganbajun]